MKSGEAEKLHFLSLHYSNLLVSILLQIKTEKSYCNYNLPWTKISGSPVDQIKSHNHASGELYADLCF